MKLSRIKFLGIGLLAIASLMSSCIKDTGNYEYNYGNEVTIRITPSSVTGFIGDPVTMSPTRTYAVPGKTAKDYDHEWYINGELVSQDSTLVYVSQIAGSSMPVRYYMIDKESGVRYAGSNASMTITSPFSAGWGVLYEKGGKSEIAHIRVTSGQYFDYVDLYKAANNGEDLGSNPLRIKDYPVNGGRTLAIIQTGGQGPVKLDAQTNIKKLATKDAFVGGVPAGLSPVNMASYATSALLINADGKVYPRFWTGNPIAYTVPWLNIPMQIEKGMRITDLWDVWAGFTTYAFMYDQLNNRVLYVRLDASNTTGGVAVIDTLPAPGAGGYPEDHVNPNNMGAWKYVWGGTFNDANYNGDAAILMQAPSGNDMYLQTFNFRMNNRVPELTPLKRLTFTGSSLVNAQSKYVAIKSRNYLFFSGGTGNRNLYYFDLVTGNAPKLYATFNSPITVLRQNDNSLELAVGMENGTLEIYNINDATLISGNPAKLHTLSGLGKVVDIVWKNGNMR
jgi:hypothetical protein